MLQRHDAEPQPRQANKKAGRKAEEGNIEIYEESAEKKGKHKRERMGWRCIWKAIFAAEAGWGMMLGAGLED